MMVMLLLLLLMLLLPTPPPPPQLPTLQLLSLQHYFGPFVVVLQLVNSYSLSPPPSLPSLLPQTSSCTGCCRLVLPLQSLNPKP